MDENKKTRAGVVGLGNVGKGVIQSIRENEKMYNDITLDCIISRRPKSVEKTLIDMDIIDRNNVNVYAMDENWQNAELDVAILCGGSARDLPEQGPTFAHYFNTVDSFDNHDHLPPYKDEETGNWRLGYANTMNDIAKANDNVSFISGGWDPGTFSLIRTLMAAILPGVKARGFYGLKEKGGLSMGHTDAIRRNQDLIEMGVEDARQYTHAKHDAIDRVLTGENPDLSKGDMHWRECLVVVKKGSDLEKIKDFIVNMPNYYEPYETTVEFVSQKKMDKKHSSMFHDGMVVAVGYTGDNNKAIIKYENLLDSNPEITANTLVALARATHRLSQEGASGAKTIVNVPIAYLVPYSQEELVKDFM
ncbi:diaminopimelate dehydrogenase [Candidatus Woesearchaeota archaeon]|nr:diaminopimelate dehydrogenase [Candidatus Woesearchaeota archaeon]